MAVKVYVTQGRVKQGPTSCNGAVVPDCVDPMARDGPEWPAAVPFGAITSVALKVALPCDVLSHAHPAGQPLITAMHCAYHWL